MIATFRLCNVGYVNWDARSPWRLLVAMVRAGAQVQKKGNLYKGMGTLMDPKTSHCRRLGQTTSRWMLPGCPVVNFSPEQQSLEVLKPRCAPLAH